MTYSRTLTKPATGPKHGKVDAKGMPHVGGDTWAGGTGNYSPQILISFMNDLFLDVVNIFQEDVILLV